MAFRHDQEVERGVRRVMDTMPTPQTKQAAERYYREMRARNLKLATCLRRLLTLRDFARRRQPRPFEDVNRGDIIDYLNVRHVDQLRVTKAIGGGWGRHYTRRTLRDGTIDTRRVHLLMFYKWLRGTDETPPEVRKLSRISKTPSLNPGALLSPDELRRMMDACRGLRERVALAVLIESGMRASEFCSLRWGDLYFESDRRLGASVTLPSDAPGLKTGARTIHLFESAPYLREWQKMDRRTRTADTPLFTMWGNASPVPANPGGLGPFVKKIARRAKVHKRVFPHLFRHVAATLRAKIGWTEGEMRAYFGWSRDSEMPGIYVHMAGLDYIRMEFQRRGLVPTRGYEDMGVPVRKCPGCRALSLPGAARCDACGAGFGGDAGLPAPLVYGGGGDPPGAAALISV